MAVEVSGDQNKDGIYFLPDGITINDALCLIGIPQKNRDRKIDPVRIFAGSALTVSSQGAVTMGYMATVRRLALGIAVDLNHVSEEELLLVPGIGEKTASQIIRLREEVGGFRHIDDLMVLPGIKEKKLNALKGYLMVRTAQGEL
jgi:competence protein ComEA